MKATLDAVKKGLWLSNGMLSNIWLVLSDCKINSNENNYHDYDMYYDSIYMR